MGYHQKGLCKGYVLECYIGQNLQKRIHMTLFPFLESFNDMFWVMLDPPWNVLPSARSCVPPSPKTADSPVAAAMATWGSGKTPSRSWGSVKMRRQRRWLVAPLWSPWASSHCDEMWWDVSTLWLCQNSYWKWPEIVDFPMKNGDFPIRFWYVYHAGYMAKFQETRWVHPRDRGLPR